MNKTEFSYILKKNAFVRNLQRNVNIIVNIKCVGAKAVSQSEVSAWCRAPEDNSTRH